MFFFLKKIEENRTPLSIYILYIIPWYLNKMFKPETPCGSWFNLFLFNLSFPPPRHLLLEL